MGVTMNAEDMREQLFRDATLLLESAYSSRIVGEVLLLETCGFLLVENAQLL